MFFEIIAGIFLIIFLIKVLDPFILPGFKKLWRLIIRGFNYLAENFGSILYQGIKFFFLLFSIMFESLFKGIKSLFTDTIKVLGLIVIAAIILNSLITTIAYPMIFNLDTWFTLFIKSFFEVYTFCFTTGVYLYGLYERVSNPRRSFFYFSSNGIDLEEIFKRAYQGRNTRYKSTLNDRKRPNQHKDSKKTVYVYDEQNDEYKRNN